MATQITDAQLFEETFTITDVNSQKYDRVSRLSATSVAGDTSFTLDIHHLLYPCSKGETVQLVLATTLALDGSKDDGRGWRDAQSGTASLADSFDYVCHGKVYRFEEGSGETIKVFVSFGGLLLYLEGPYKKLVPLRIDYVYLLLKK